MPRPILGACRGRLFGRELLQRHLDDQVLADLLQLAAQISKLTADPATREKLTAISLEPLPPSTPDSFAAYIKSEVDRWAVIVKNSGAEAE